MNKRKTVIIFLLLDILASIIAWYLFNLFRKSIIESEIFGYQIPLEISNTFLLGLVLTPIYWVFLYWMAGSYRKPYRKSRLRELGSTFAITFLGSLLLFFVLLLDDMVRSFEDYRYTFLTLFALNFVLRSAFRITHLNTIKKLISKRKIGFSTLLIGSNSKALRLYEEIESEKRSQGYIFRGYLTVKQHADPIMASYLPHLGDVKDLERIVREKSIEDVIIALESQEHSKINDIVDQLADLDVSIKVIPDTYDIIMGSVKMNHIFGAALIEIFPEIMPQWQKNLKRLIDIVVSCTVLVFFSPLYLALAIWVKYTSEGPVFYRQERIGYKGKPFEIIKFRSMYIGAEKSTPMLSQEHDPRITSAGRVLRKYRLDEIPQFYNVLIGEMSLVGPRPERQYFIDQITEQAPHYRHLLKVKPGITSWGQVKFGYASNVEEMVRRLKFDILYIENMSIGMDIKILLYTVIILIDGRGK